jgi:cytoskeletal protein CcmA (bactofilin family)
MLKRQEKEPMDISRDEVIAFMGSGTEFKGVITYQQGTIRIDGRVEGEVITQGTLVIGETAEIHAEINAATVISSGKIIGNITATEKIKLLPTAVLEGAIKSPLLVIEEGVRFNGQCMMGKPGGAREAPIPSMAGAEGKGREG